MKNKTENFILAILWSMVLITHIIEIITGTYNPTTFDVFAPLILLVAEYWMEYLDGCWRD